MGRYLSARETAARLIEAHGGLAILSRTTPGSFDPVTQQTTGGGTSSWTFRVVVLPPGMAQRFGVDLEGKNAREVYFALDGAPVLPQPGDRLTLATGETGTLFWVQTYDPAMDGPIMTVAYAEWGAP